MTSTAVTSEPGIAPSLRGPMWLEEETAELPGLRRRRLPHGARRASSRRAVTVVHRAHWTDHEWSMRRQRRPLRRTRGSSDVLARWAARTLPVLPSLSSPPLSEQDTRRVTESVPGVITTQDMSVSAGAGAGITQLRDASLMPLLAPARGREAHRSTLGPPQRGAARHNARGPGRAQGNARARLDDQRRSPRGPATPEKTVEEPFRALAYVYGGGGPETSSDRAGLSPEQDMTAGQAAGAAARASSRVGEQARGQARVDAAYAWSGQDWGKPPEFRLDQRNPAETGPNGVTFGPAALRRGDAMLRATVIHEGVHVKQLKEGNYGKNEASDAAAAAGFVNEAEAYREVLRRADEIGLSSQEVQTFADRYQLELTRLADMKSPSARPYLRQILLEQNFTLRPQDRIGGGKQ